MKLNSYIEHTSLSPTLTVSEIDQLVDEAKEFNLFGICVPPFWVKRAKREIGSSPVQLVTVAGFPLGYNMTETKIDDIKHALHNGADEIDLVWNLSSFKTGMGWEKIEIVKCGKLVHDAQKLLKVIIETAYLNTEEIIHACKICSDAGADFVKTSTGFASAGATVENISLMRKNLPESVGIKASGGIKNYDQALQMIQSGADRIGTSSGVTIVTDKKNNP